ncbi:MAG: RNA polymerase sigma factor [Flavobacteriales bacterium]
MKTSSSSSEASLNEIVEGAGKNQQWAQVALYDKFFQPAYYTAYRIVKDKMSAEDAVHEGFIKAFDKISTLKNPKVVEGWLKRIVLNEALQRVKSEKHYSDPITDDQIAEEELAEEEKNIPLGNLLESIEELPEGYRIISQLNLIEEMKHEEIAESLGITASTSRSQLARAKTKLKEIIHRKGLVK